MFQEIHKVVLDLVGGHGYRDRERNEIDEVMLILLLELSDFH